MSDFLTSYTSQKASFLALWFSMTKMMGDESIPESKKGKSVFLRMMSVFDIEMWR